MNKLNIIAGMCVIAAVSACSSSSSNNGGGGTTGGGSASVSDLVATLSAAPGAGNGNVTTNQLSTLSAELDALEAAIDDQDNPLAAPASLPAGTGTFTGYVGVDNEDTEAEVIVGNLTIEANFDNGTVTSATADGFQEFDFTNPSAPVATSTLGVTGGSVSSTTGTISTTQITVSDFNGTVNTTQGDLAVASTLSGDVYDADGNILIEGNISGTAGGDPIDGEFVASN